MFGIVQLAAAIATGFASPPHRILDAYESSTS